MTRLTFDYLYNHLFDPSMVINQTRVRFVSIKIKIQLPCPSKKKGTTIAVINNKPNRTTYFYVFLCPTVYIHQQFCPFFLFFIFATKKKLSSKLIIQTNWCHWTTHPDYHHHHKNDGSAPHTLRICLSMHNTNLIIK